jgi:hypothetical protein
MSIVVVHHIAAGMGIRINWHASDYYGLVVMMSLLTGLCFQFPLALIILMWLELVRPMTLLKSWRGMLLGIVDPDEGTRTLLGTDRPLDVARRVGYLPEERGLYRKMRVAEFLRFMAQLKGLDRNAADQRIGPQQAGVIQQGQRGAFHVHGQDPNQRSSISMNTTSWSVLLITLCSTPTWRL